MPTSRGGGRPPSPNPPSEYCQLLSARRPERGGHAVVTLTSTGLVYVHTFTHHLKTSFAAARSNVMWADCRCASTPLCERAAERSAPGKVAAFDRELHLGDTLLDVAVTARLNCTKQHRTVASPDWNATARAPASTCGALGPCEKHPCATVTARESVGGNFFRKDKRLGAQQRPVATNTTARHTCFVVGQACDSLVTSSRTNT
eukprot:7385754-Prymnesium_polylepis.3